MSKLQELIQRFCPDGVEYKTLGDYINIYTGSQLNKRDMQSSGSYPVQNGGINISGYTELYNEEANTITISQGGASAGHVKWMACNFYAGAHCYVVKLINNASLNNRYLYYFLKRKEIMLMNAQYGAGIPALDRNIVTTLSIPLPPLDVQNEIVRILDTFTSHIAELQAELQARKEQYEYYRNKLLTFDKDDKNVKWMKLGEIGTFIRGNGLQKKDFTKTGFPCIHYGQIHTHYGTFADTTISHTSFDLAEKLRKASYGDLIIATTSEDVDGVCKACAWLGKNDVAVSGDAYI